MNDFTEYFRQFFTYKNSSFLQVFYSVFYFLPAMFKFLIFIATFSAIKSTNISHNIDELSIFAKVNQFPHQVAVLGDNGNEVKCSGTIVDEFTVLCAANCVEQPKQKFS